ncbi:MAG: HAMP domain-containing sensor histidine kinase [Chloroflexota bacterium]
MSLRWRLTLWSSIVLAVLIAVLGLLAFFFVRYFLFEGVDANLDRQTTATLTYVYQRQDQNLQDLGQENRVDAVFYTIINLEGVIESKDRDIPINPDYVLQALEGDTVVKTQLLPNGGSVRVMLKPIRVRPSNRIGGVLQAATPLAYIDQVLSEMTILLSITSFALLVVGAFGSYMLTGRAFRAVAQVTKKVHQIELSQDISQRLPESGRDDEVSTLIVTFNRLLSRLQEAFEAQRRFVADSSHELRTPLTVIKSNLHLLRQTSSPSERVELLGIAEGEVARLNRMVNDLLYMAQMQAGHDLKPILSPVELDSLLLDVFARARPLTTLKHQKLTLIHEDIAATMGDRDQIQHLLLNLLDNAIKYTGEGGIITLGLWTEEGWGRIEVSDNGPGIPEAELPLVFDRFFRTQDARQTERNGSGLGLSIVKSIIDAHNGKIEVYSKIGEGTTFRIWLRIIDSPLAPELDYDVDQPEVLPAPSIATEPTLASTSTQGNP